MRSRYKIVVKDGIYFTTSTIIEWIPVFTSKVYFDILIETLKFCQLKKNLKIHGYVILDNHFHVIISGPELSKIMQSLKSFTSKQIIEQLQKDDKQWLLNQLTYYRQKHKIESAHQVWQEGFHPQLMERDDVLIQKMDYMHNNPVKRGFVDSPEHWRYSSARNYILDDHSVLRIDFLDGSN